MHRTHTIKERIKWLDVTRCIGIFLIYLGHCGNYAGPAYPFVFTHHVALFFFISGCAANLSPVSSVSTAVKKTVKDIIIPWLLFAFVALVINTLHQNVSRGIVFQNLIYIFKGSVRNTFTGGLWFLTCIAVVRIVFAVIVKLKKNILILLACVGLHLVAEFVLPNRPIVAPSWPYNVDSAMYYIVYYALGYIAFPYINKGLSSKSLHIKICVYLSVFVCWIYAANLFFSKDLLSCIPWTGCWSVLHGILRTLMVTWAYIGVAKMLENVSILAQIGQNTLYLCGSEYFSSVLFQVLLSSIGLGVAFKTPLHAYSYSILLLLATFYFVVPIEKKVLSNIYQLPKTLKESQMCEDKASSKDSITK